MADAPQNFMNMFHKLGEQLKVPSFDMGQIMEQHQKNLDAMTRSWQTMASGASAVAANFKYLAFARSAVTTVARNAISEP